MGARLVTGGRAGRRWNPARLVVRARVLFLAGAWSLRGLPAGPNPALGEPLELEPFHARGEFVRSFFPQPPVVLEARQGRGLRGPRTALVDPRAP
jgi:hypothetical protein